MGWRHAKPTTPAPRKKKKRKTSPRTANTGDGKRVSRSTHLTDTEKWQLALRYALLPVNMEPGANFGKRLGVAALEERSNVARGYIANHLDVPALLKAKADTPPNQRKERSDKGTVRKWTPELRAKLGEQALAWNYVFTFEDMTLALKDAGHDISSMQICRKLREENWNLRARARTVPLLTEAHRLKRVAYAQEMVDDDWSAHVDLDEKWWYAMCAWRTHKLGPPNR